MDMNSSRLGVENMEFGSRLKERRESQGFTLNDVEQETKIRKLYIKAIENEEFSVLPPRVYAIGFVKRYAKFLNLDEIETVEQFKELAYIDENEEEEQKPQNQYRPAVLTEELHRKTRFNFKNLLAAVVFLIIVVWLGNWLVGYITRGVEQAERTKPPVADQRGPKQAETPAGNTITEAKVIISSSQKCWIKVDVDGVEQFQGFILAGQQKSFTGQERVYIKAGNAGALAVSLNDKDLGSIGKTGEVVEYEFLKDGTMHKL